MIKLFFGVVQTYYVNCEYRILGSCKKYLLGGNHHRVLVVYILVEKGCETLTKQNKEN